MHAAGEHNTVSEMESHILPGISRPERWLEYRGRRIDTGLYAGGRIEHFYDITERRNAALQREIMLVELESQKAELERFAYTVSHDLKSPLITIQGFLGILNENLLAGAVADAQEDMERIKNAANRMERLLEELLELARVGRDEGSIERVGLADVVSEVLEMLEGNLERRCVTVSVHDGMPFAWGCRARLVEVFQNLIDNAAKYAGDQKTPRIEIGAKQRDRDVLCFVRDNGVGVDLRYAGRIFDLFEQLDPSKEGTGVGLAIVKRIVETHGGRIWVESEGSGCGSTFWFTLANPVPVDAEETKEPQATSGGKNQPA